MELEIEVVLSTASIRWLFVSLARGVLLATDAGKESSRENAVQ